MVEDNRYRELANTFTFRFANTFMIFFFETDGQKLTPNGLKSKDKTRPHQGEAEPLRRVTPPRKENKTDSNRKQPTEPT
jgi:hypothetical protein